MREDVVMAKALSVVQLRWERNTKWIRWCGFEEALKLLKWKENKEALKTLNEIPSAHK